MNKLYFLIFFWSINSFSINAPESYIQTNNGLKITIKPSFFRIDNKEKLVYYKPLNSESESKIKFKDFDYVLIGINKFKTYRITDSKEVNGYFVLADTNSNTLICSTIPNEDDESTTVKYVLYILDADNIIVDGLVFDNLKNTKSNNTRGEIYSKIEFYFKGCQKLIDRLTPYGNVLTQNTNMDILNFFDSPVYVDCL